MTILKAGARLKSAVCDTEIMVIRAPANAVELSCGGSPMLTPDGARASDAQPAADSAAGSLVGKRYVDAQDSIELLCTKGGKGTLAMNGAALAVKVAKALPSSD
jgi:hypothetical protein